MSQSRFISMERGCRSTAKRLQALCGVPVSESAQYARCALVAECARPVYEELVRQTAQAEVIHTDDTRLVILDLVKANKGLPADGRRAAQTPSIVARAGKRQIALYFSGRRHAEENLAAVLGQRAAELAPPIQMSDALAANWTRASLCGLWRSVWHMRAVSSSTWKLGFRKSVGGRLMRWRKSIGTTPRRS